MQVADWLEQLEPFLADWDRLAEEAGQPFGRPDWLLGWWRARSEFHQPPGALRIVLVSDEQGLAGVAPMFIEDPQARVARWRFLGQLPFWGVGPVVRPEGAERTVGSMAEALASAPAGRKLSLLMTAYDPRWRSTGAGLISILAGIEEGFRLGDELCDLGFGARGFKRRIANQAHALRWLELFPRDRRYPIARAHALPAHGRNAADRARARVQARGRLRHLRARVGETIRSGQGR